MGDGDLGIRFMGFFSGLRASWSFERHMFKAGKLSL